ncbi:hypothetical protein [Arthrobacter sp. ISL-65]|uniref:hypothetical protein n=1 Tax=Arthrobacter sp. ISL-65 TaxID=2819112 RepID=UPI001BE84315|nr:hypothetical protein [Arthrobacter sp. ISL-65]MBT2549753.1 hypothetical protein [Arthrobacter sp. ISL-65]
MFGKDNLPKLIRVDGKPKRRLPLILSGLGLAAMLALAGLFWFGQAVPAQQAAQVQAAAKAQEDEAAKKKKAESDAFWAKVDAENKAQREKDAKALAAFEASDGGEAETTKREMEKLGWTQFAGDFYYQFADKSEYSCSYSKCLVVHVTTMAPAGCPGGLYVEATVDAGGASVGRANSITAALPQGKDAIVKLTDTSGAGEAMALTDLHCLRG